MLKILLLITIMSTSIISISQDHYMITGTYTQGNSNGIYVYSFNKDNGSFSLVDSAVIENPSYLAVSADNRFVYAVNELGNNSGGGMVTAFSFDNRTGKLKFLNSRSSRGENPCYVSIDRTGNWLAVGNYSSGTAAILPIQKNGMLDEAVSVVEHQGSSINKKRQEAAHVHATVFSPDNRFLYVPDLGIDKLVAYTFNEQTGNLTAASSHTIKMEEGYGPRHFEFHPGHNWAYLLNELSGMVSVFKNDENNLSLLQTISALPEGFDKPFTSADIHVSADGKFLYASNRDASNTIAIFKINRETGTIKLAGHQSTLGKTPRNFSLDPTGNFLLVANQNSDNIIVFRINRSTGLLTAQEQTIEVGSPVCIKWIQKAD